MIAGSVRYASLLSHMGWIGDWLEDSQIGMANLRAHLCFCGLIPTPSVA